MMILSEHELAQLQASALQVFGVGEMAVALEQHGAVVHAPASVGMSAAKVGSVTRKLHKQFAEARLTVTATALPWARYQSTSLFSSLLCAASSACCTRATICSL